MVFILLWLNIFVYAQDIVTLRNGDEIKAKVTEISKSEIKYKRFDNLEGPTIIIPLADVFFINYDNGTREIFNPLIDRSSEQETKNTFQSVPLQNPTVEKPTYETVSSKEKVQLTNGHTKFQVSLVAGILPIKNTRYFLYGLNCAYFFNHHSGLGLVQRQNLGSYEGIQQGNELQSIYKKHYQNDFLGIAYFGNLGKRNGKLFFSTRIGIGWGRNNFTSESESKHYYYVGWDEWKLEDTDKSLYLKNANSLSFLLSAGLTYRPLKCFSIGLYCENNIGIEFQKIEQKRIVIDQNMYIRHIDDDSFKRIGLGYDLPFLVLEFNFHF